MAWDMGAGGVEGWMELEMGEEPGERILHS